MAAVTVALLIWGSKYISKSVYIWCDNNPTVGQLSKRSVPFKREDLMKLIRIITKDSITTEYHYFIDWLEGKSNKTADALSRFYTQPFKNLSSVEQKNISSTPTNCLKAVQICIASYFKAIPIK